jgi:beta-glucosidase
VQDAAGPALTVPLTSAGPFAMFYAQTYHRSAPLRQIAVRLPQAHISYRDGRYVSEAVDAARRAEVAVVFATEWRTEGFDVPDLRLPDGQDALIAAVAAANPNTIVVLETGGPVLMPWLEQTAGVIEAWYPGARGAEALAAILFGEVNPSGKLPVTFPASLAQLPRPALPGADTVEPGFANPAPPGTVLNADYDVEGSDVGYRWFARRAEQPLFPFGFGLSYTRFSYADLRARGGADPTARFTVTNRGQRAGKETAQLYLVGAPQGPRQRLIGWAKLDLQPGETGTADLHIDRRLLADYDSAAHDWQLAGGNYTLAAGPSAAELPLQVTIRLSAARLPP